MIDLGDVRRITVFRALVLGDLLCATPALRALRAAWPRAEITLLGLPWAAELAARLPTIDRFETFPGHPGLPEVAPDLAAWPALLQRVQAAPPDLLVQLHGSGDILNSLLGLFGARHVAGYAEPGMWCADPALHRPWPRTGTEVERLLALTDHLGLPRQGVHLDFPVQDSDRARLRAAVPELDALGRFAIVHAGAQLPSRRWPLDRFAEVANALADRGLRLVLTGTPGEASLVRALAEKIQHPVLDLTGRTDLWSLGALVERARLVVCNDTGLSHIAAALATPSVVVSSGADVARWAPHDAARHPVLWHDTPCRPCAFRDCPYGHPCALGVAPGRVLEHAFALERTNP